MFNKNHFSHENGNPHVWNTRCAKFKKTLSIFNFGTNLGLTGGKYFIKIIFNMKRAH